jgi:hypothetical protein
MLSCKNLIVYKVNKYEPKQCSAPLLYYILGTETAEEL